MLLCVFPYQWYHWILRLLSLYDRHSWHIAHNSSVWPVSYALEAACCSARIWCRCTIERCYVGSVGSFKMDAPRWRESSQHAEKIEPRFQGDVRGLEVEPSSHIDLFKLSELSYRQDILEAAQRFQVDVRRHELKPDHRLTRQQEGVGGVSL